MKGDVGLKKTTEDAGEEDQIKLLKEIVLMVKTDIGKK